VTIAPPGPSAASPFDPAGSFAVRWQVNSTGGHTQEPLQVTHHGMSLSVLHVERVSLQRLLTRACIHCLAFCSDLSAPNAVPEVSRDMHFASGSGAGRIPAALSAASRMVTSRSAASSRPGPRRAASAATRVWNASRS